jgi:hypothetical protein
MTTTAFPTRRPGATGGIRVGPRPAATLRPRRQAANEEDVRRSERARMEEAAIEAGRWLRRTGRVSLPVRARR